jgi:hypothetical protein
VDTNSETPAIKLLQKLQAYKMVKFTAQKAPTNINAVVYF